MVKSSFWQRMLGKKLADQLPEERKTGYQLNSLPLGSYGTESYYGYSYEEYLSTLRGVDRANIFDQMRRSDSQVIMILSAVKNPIKAATWSIEPGDDSEEAAKDAELIKHILFSDMNQTWKEFLSEALTCVDFGHAVFEVTHKVVLNHPVFGSYNGIRELGWRSPRTIERWILDSNTGKLSAIEQWAHGDLDRKVIIPASSLLIFSLGKEGANYEGISLLRGCYGNWLRKNTYLKLNAIGIEKHAIPTPKVKVPKGKENSEEAQRIELALQYYTAHQKAYFMYPEGYEVDFSSNEYDPEKVEKSIDAEDRRMTKIALANFLELGMNSTGSYALSNDLSDFFLSGLIHIAEGVAETITKSIIQPIIKMNRANPFVYPTLKASGIDDKAGKELAESFKLLVEGRMITPDDRLEENLRKRFGMPDADKNTARQLTPSPSSTQQAPQTLAEKIRLAENKRLKV